MMEKYIVALGRVCVDEYYEIQTWPEMGTKEFVKPLGSQIGGMIANAASILAGYGLKVYYLDLLPENSASTALILDDLKKYSVCTDLIQFDSEIPDTKCMIYLLNGEKVIFITDVKRPLLELNSKDRERLCNAGYLYSTLLDIRELKDYEQILEQIIENGGAIAVDVEANSFADRKEADKILRYCESVFMNERAFSKYGNSEPLSQTVNHLLGLGIKLLVVSKGDKGCEVFTKEESFSQEAFKVEAVDTTGAGDTFNSSFLYGLLAGKTLQESEKFASAAAARAVTMAGPRSGVTREAVVEQFMEMHKRG